MCVSYGENDTHALFFGSRFKNVSNVQNGCIKFPCEVKMKTKIKKRRMQNHFQRGCFAFYCNENVLIDHLRIYTRKQTHTVRARKRRVWVVLSLMYLILQKLYEKLNSAVDLKSTSECSGCIRGYCEIRLHILFIVHIIHGALKEDERLTFSKCSYEWKLSCYIYFE